MTETQTISPVYTVRTALEDAARRLAVFHDSAKLDAEVLLCHVLEEARAHLYARPEQGLTGPQWWVFEHLVTRREEGEPIAYLTGRREFWSLALGVSRDTLIPRPDTELLVELALGEIPEHASWLVADLGTGSGAIGLAIARERPACEVLATDRSAGALKVARDNMRRLGIRNISLVQADWCRPFASSACEIIIANPPYVREADPHLMQGDVRFEPRHALVGGDDGLDAIRAIGQEARTSLRTDGSLLLEHGHDQARQVRELLTELGYREVKSHRDLADKQRVTQARA